MRDSKRYVVLKAMGIGGFGGVVIERLLPMRIPGLGFVIMDTDIHHDTLVRARCPNKIRLGPDKGLWQSSVRSAQMDAENNRDIIERMLFGAHTVFLIAGMGGTIGTGATPVVAGIAKRMNIKTVSIVSMPLECEGKPRMDKALKAVDELRGLTGRVVTMLQILDNEILETMLFTDILKQRENAVCRYIQDLAKEYIGDWQKKKLKFKIRSKIQELELLPAVI